MLIAMGVFAATVASQPVADVLPFARAPAMAQVALSPDGASVSFLRQQGAKQQVILRSLATSDEHETLEVESKRERVRWCDWAGPRYLLCGTVVPVRRPDRISEATRLYSIDSRTRRVRELNHRLPDAVRDNVIDLWPQRPGYVLLQHDPVGKGFPEVSELNVATGELHLLVRSQPPISRWMSDGLGSVRLGIAHTATTATLYSRASDASGWEILLQQSLHDPDAIAPLAFAEGGMLVLRHHEGRAALFRWKLDPAAAPQLLFADPVHDVDGALFIDPRTRRLLAVRYAAQQERHHYFDTQARELQRWLDARLSRTFNEIIDLDLEGRRQLVRASADIDPPSYYLLDSRERTLELLGHEYPALEDRDLVPMQAVEYAARDGQTIPAYLTLPKGGGSHLPSVVIPHGGPETRVVRGFDPLVQFLAANGFAVLQMNFRGSFGYGAGFAAAGVGQWGGVIHNDITDGTRWLVEREIADPARICIVGESFGGYAALLGAVRESQWYACAVSFAGVSDLMAFQQYTQRLQSAEIWNERLGSDQQALWQMSPLARVHSLATPVFLMHGRLDPVVPVSQARRFARTLRQQDKPHRFLERIECDHEMTIESCRVEFFAETREFLRSSTQSPAVTEHRP